MFALAPTRTRPGSVLRINRTFGPVRALGGPPGTERGVGGRVGREPHAGRREAMSVSL